MTVASLIQRPELTLPEAEAAKVQAAYARAAVILEYGSGGSTVLAAEMPGKQVFSVESDNRWAKMMRGYFEQNPPAEGTNVEVIWSDIGPTKEWGYPKSDASWQCFANYPLEVWDHSSIVQPDVVLIDGRFRVGCALATLFRTTKPVTLLFDDYVGRPHYARVEEFLGKPALIGRMAQFHVVPTPIPQQDLLKVITYMQRP